MSGRGPGIALALPRTADGRPILARADLDGYDRPRRSGGRDRYYCPIHGGDHQRSLSVDAVTGAYMCFSCGARGVLRDYWPERSEPPEPSRRRAPATPAPLPNAEEVGRREIARRADVDAARAGRLTHAAPSRRATAFLARLDAMNGALRDPDCPGAAYLRGRGLDPVLAADLGAGYAAPDVWPGDRGRAAGRIVYPLADPATGTIVSALGRLCVDQDARWSAEVTAAFKRLKQRKLAGCPAGVWPYGSVATAVRDRRPLVLVEGPADALALLRRARQPLAVVALIGTANVLPAALLRAVAGVVAALDEDGSGAYAARELCAACMIAGARVEIMPAGWLGGGATDLGDLAARLAGAREGDDVAARYYDAAISAIRLACARLAALAWDEDAATTVLAHLYERHAEAPGDPHQPWSPLPAATDQAIAEACAARDWAALMAAVAAREHTYAHGASLPKHNG
jgi:hypothetical protein